MEHLREELSEISYALHCIAANLHMGRRPTWDQVADHIAHQRFPKDGLNLNGYLIGRHIRGIVRGIDPDIWKQDSGQVILKGRPDMLITFERNYSRSPLRETYKALFINPEEALKHPSVPTDFFEGIIATGSPSKLHVYVQLRDHTLPGRPALIKDYPPKNIIPSSVEDHRKSVVIRALRRIGVL